MNGKYLIINNSTDRQVVEHVSEVLPHLGVAILALTFCVEPIYLCNLSGLMVAS